MRNDVLFGSKEWERLYRPDYAKPIKSHSSKLKSCPCGKIPETLVINDENLILWSLVCGDCCHSWHIEFKSDYATGDELMSKAIDAWNNAPRVVL
jgi:hypothetical protein